MYSTEELKKEVKRLATTYPNTVYKRGEGECFYTKGETESGTGCIFGQAITNLYPELRCELEEIDSLLEAGDTNGYVGYPIKVVLDMLRFEPWENANSIQKSQDCGTRWCDCIE